MKTQKTPLSLLAPGAKFKHNNITHTVYAMNYSGNMAEVFANGRFWAWPIHNGKQTIEVEAIV